MATSIFTNPISTSNSFKSDIYGTSFDSTVEIYNALANFASSEKDGIVKLPSGQEVDVTKISGMTTYSTYLQFLLKS